MLVCRFSQSKKRPQSDGFSTVKQQLILKEFSLGTIAIRNLSHSICCVGSTLFSPYFIPSHLPSFIRHPPRVKGMPVFFDTRLLALVTPSARFHENDKPGSRLKTFPNFNFYSFDSCDHNAAAASTKLFTVSGYVTTTEIKCGCFLVPFFKIPVIEAVPFNNLASSSRFTRLAE